MVFAKARVLPAVVAPAAVRIKKKLFFCVRNMAASPVYIEIS
jgi:hypothetical protein